MARIFVVLLAAVGLFGATIAAASNRPVYAISLEISSSGRSIATPRLDVRAGEIGSVSSSGRYDIHFVATPDPDRPGNVLVSTSITLAIADGQRRMSWTASVAEGEDATFESPSRADSAPLTVVVNAQSVSR